VRQEARAFAPRHHTEQSTRGAGDHVCLRPAQRNAGDDHVQQQERRQRVLDAAREVEQQDQHHQVDVDLHCEKGSARTEVAQIHAVAEVEQRQPRGYGAEGRAHLPRQQCRHIHGHNHGDCGHADGDPPHDDEPAGVMQPLLCGVESHSAPAVARQWSRGQQRRAVAQEEPARDARGEQRGRNGANTLQQAQQIRLRLTQPRPLHDFVDAEQHQHDRGGC
jgi:hypothetical protein